MADRAFRGPNAVRRRVLALALLAFARAAAASDGLPARIPVELAKEDEPGRKLSRALRSALSASGGKSLTFIADLREQVDFTQVAVALERAARPTRRAWVARALKTIATRSQRKLRPLLEKLRREGEIESWTPFSIVNRLVVKGRPSAVDALARRREVASLEGEMVFEGSSQQKESAPKTGAVPSWALESMAVERAWEARVDGSGVVV